MKYKYNIQGIEKGKKRTRKFFSNISTISEMKKVFKNNNPNFIIKFIAKHWTYEKLLGL